ncbi:MAG: UdgX family uracil-DNA binding protein [Rhodanobacteraceae bacterium]
MERFAAVVDPPWSLDAWRKRARDALRADVPPDALDWSAGEASTLPFARSIADAQPRHDTVAVPKRFLAVAARVLCHRDEHRFSLLYRALWRLAHGERHLLEIATDIDVRRLHDLAKAVQRDSHKMKAFVRFRELPGERDRFIAWFEPDHFIVDRVAPFFARRFAGMRWAILTPYRSVAWDGSALEFGAGAQRSDAPSEDAGEKLWRTYYAHIFNPARANPDRMRQEMPVRYWKNLPEATTLPNLLRDAGARVAEMAARAYEPPHRRIPERAVDPEVPVTHTTIASLRKAAHDCRECELWKPATQTVFGEGPADARIVLVGEQPGDREDLVGRPFVGPAGEVLDRALAEAGIDRDRIYLTNAVKHFRFELRGKRRLHKNPDRAHVAACAHWLDAEIAVLKPRVIVCLGAIAAQRIFGPKFALMKQRGVWHPNGDGARALATVHPSFVLRQRDERERAVAYRMLVDDLSLIAGVEQE